MDLMTLFARISSYAATHRENFTECKKKICQIYGEVLKMPSKVVIKNICSSK